MGPAGAVTVSGRVSSREKSVMEERARILTVRMVLTGQRGHAATAGGFALVCE